MAFQLQIGLLRVPTLLGFRIVLAAWLILFAPAPGSAADTPVFTAGTARSDITPDLRLTNWITHKAYGAMLEPIYARAVVLGQGTNRVVLLSWELLYPMEGATAEVRRRVYQATGIPESHILVSATHNHSAPWSPVLGDPLTKAEQKVLESFLNDPLYPDWKEKLFNESARAVKEADASRVPASLSIGRAYAGEMIFNRRPRKADGTVQSMASPPNPYALPNGLRFGPMDPAMTVLALRTTSQKPIVTLYNLPCHAVGIYPSYDGISGDWPGALSAILKDQTGADALFLQGCAGDIVPFRRGLEARTQMTALLGARAMEAIKLSQSLPMTSPLRVDSRRVKAPLDELPRKEMAREYVTPEVQVVTCGDLAIVALPGEPLIGLALDIQKRSPFPHTLVVGYSNGYGTQYVGMPGEKALGGYEASYRNLGKDECGQLLVDAAVDILHEHRPR